MNSISCILAATDFSTAGDRAVRRAALIAKQHDADLHLLHAVHPLDLYPGPDMEPVPPNTELPQADGARLGTLARLMSEHYGVRTHIAWRIGRAYSRIAYYAHEVGADLVVVGAEPEASMMQFTHSSTECKLLRVHTGPLLIVRTGTALPYQRVIAALDFSPDAHAALSWARLIGPQAHLDVLHVIEPNHDSHSEKPFMPRSKTTTKDDTESMLDTLLKEVPGPHALHVTGGEPLGQILKLAERQRSELIVLGQQGRNGLDEFLYGSVSTAVAQTANCDVLVVTRHEDESQP